MRKIIIGLFLMTFGVILSTGLFAQPSPTNPPAPPDNKGTNGNQPPPYQPPTPGPLEPGTGILLILAAAYGMKKVREAKRT
jgi:hypothetical protein